MLHGTAAKGFGLQTSAYEAVRPGYTDEVLQYAVQATGLGKGEGKRVLDVGAGTGKLTRQLAAHLPHAHITAVEPVAAMRDAFQRVLPSITVLEAPASQLPFKSGSVDSVFVAQAFHWFCDEVSLQELHRVLRPGGWLCLVWNMEDEGEPLVAALRAVYERYDEGIPQYRLGAWKQVFRGAWALQAFERPGCIGRSTEHARMHNGLGGNDAERSKGGGGGVGSTGVEQSSGGLHSDSGADAKGSLGAVQSLAPLCNGGSLSPDDPAAQVLSSHYLRDRSCWATPQQIWQVGQEGQVREAGVMKAARGEWKKAGGEKGNGERRVGEEGAAAQVLSLRYLGDRSCWATPQQIWQVGQEGQVREAGVMKAARGEWKKAGGEKGNGERRVGEEGAAAQVLSLRYLGDRSCWATPQQIWQRVLSKSYVAVLPPEEQDRLRYKIMEVIRQHAAAFRPAQEGGAAAAGQGVGPAVDVWGGVDPTWVACVPIRTEVVLCRKRQPL